MKIRNAVITAVLLAVLPVFSARAAVVINPLADIVFVVDESGSMSGEHAWLGVMVSNLNTNLIGAGVTDAKFALVGFGNGQGGNLGVNNLGRTLTDFTTVAGFQLADNNLVLTGGFEDGYSGINYAFNNLSFRTGAAMNIVLVTDEDRDNGNVGLTSASMLQAFKNRSALLNVVVNNPFTASGNTLLGVDSALSGYQANGSGGFNKVANGVVGNGAGATETDYVALALATGGAGWDLNQLRAGGQTAASFTAAFTAIKVAEIINQPPSNNVPDSGMTIVLLLGSLAAIAGIRRRLA